MDVFSCTEEELAKVLAADLELYSAGVRFLTGVKSGGAFSKSLDDSVDDALKTWSSANEIATNGQHYIFSVYDSWADRTGGLSEGFVVYQKVGNEMFDRIWLTPGGVPEMDDVINTLHEQKINRLLTLDIPIGGYFGLESERRDKDGDLIRYEMVNELDRKYFAENGIEILVTEP